MDKGEWILYVGRKTDPAMAIDDKGNIATESQCLFVATTEKEALEEARRRCKRMRCYLSTDKKVIAWDLMLPPFWKTHRRIIRAIFTHPIMLLRWMLKQMRGDRR